jgi:serine/threonine protein kinase
VPSDESQPLKPEAKPIFVETGDASPNEKTQLSDSTSASKGANRSAAHQSPESWVGRSIARYRIVEPLGMGAMGVVYRAFDTLIERDVAIKILPPELATDATTRNRFLAEAKSAGRLTHPHVVALHEIGEQDQTYYIVMELMAAGNLSQALQQNGPFSPAEATRIIADACQGLAAAHAAGMIHRDIKPSNLLLNADGAVKLADFGLAKRNIAGAQHLTLTGQVVGTPYYMSPEQCQSKPLDARTDIYSLGATYYSLLTGVTPYHQIESTVQVMFAHVHGEPLDPRKINPSIPDICAQIVVKATAKKPEDRYQSAAEMFSDLASAHLLLGAGPLSASHSVSRVAGSAAETPKVFRWMPFLKLSATIAAAGVVALAVWGGWSAFRSRSGQANAGAPESSGPALPLAQGVTDSTITFGTTVPYSGTNKDFGRSIVSGIRACFDQINDEGGVNGRKLKLVVLDDGYLPERALANTRELFEKRKVFALIGNAGTASVQLAVPYAIEHRLLLFAPPCGADFLRHTPPDRYVFNYRASVAEETAALVDYFVKVRRIPANHIAVFAQDDMFGEEGSQGAARAVRKYGVLPEDIVRATYPRNTLEVAPAVDKMLLHRKQVDAIVMVPTYGAAALFVKGLSDRHMNVALASVSSVSSSLAEILRGMGSQYGEGLIVSEAVPHYLSAATGVIRYREALQKYHPESEPSFLSLEGFISAECLVEGLKRAGPDLTTEKLIDALESIRDLDLGIGPIISFGPSRHQASNKVWGTVLDRNCNFQNLDLE